MPAPGFKMLKELHTLRDNTMVNVIARVQAAPPGLISLTDPTVVDQSGNEYDIVAMFDRDPNEWIPAERPQVGDVVVLFNFNKKTGFRKQNPVLYSKKNVSKVVFYNQKMVPYNQFPKREPPAEHPESQVFKYSSKLVDEWKQDPRSGWINKDATLSCPMRLKEVFVKFDTNRLTTLTGKISALDADVFMLTDAPGWSVQLEGYRFADEMRQRCRDKHSRYVTMTHDGFLFFTVYVECVDTRFLAKIRKEDEMEFFLVPKLTPEKKLRVLTSWAALGEKVKVNLVEDRVKRELGGEMEYWSVGNELELNM
ncbi:hypothetical protein CJU90_3524 [Yarrowia sp. C11]|nr:hypothetical protein CJU90_3524 [Yarrowia sp. C11]